MPTEASLFPCLLFPNFCTIMPQDVAAAFFLLTTYKACFSPISPYNIKFHIFHNTLSIVAFHIHFLCSPSSLS